MQKVKKMLALLLACLMVVSMMAACGDSADTGETEQKEENTPVADKKDEGKQEDKKEDDAKEESKGDELRPGQAPAGSYLKAAGSKNDALDPFSVSNIGKVQYRAMIYMKLGYYGDDGFESDCLVSWEPSEDGFVRTLVIEPGIYDSEGNTFDANDLKFCLDKIAEIGKISNVVSNFESIEVVDELTCKLTLKQNTVTAYTELANTTLLCTEEAYNASADGMVTDKPVGFTQYKVTEFVGGSYVELEKVQDYWQKDESKISAAYKANVDYIRINMLSETSQKISGMQTGDLQFVKDLGMVNANQLNPNDINLHYRATYNTTTTLAFNMLNGRCKDDLKLRQAICTAINKDDLIAINGTGGFVMKSVVADAYSGFNPDWANEDYYDYDLEKAKELLAESDYNGETIRFITTSNDASDIGQAIVGMLTEAGLNVELLGLETNAFKQAQQATNEEYDIMLLGIGSNAFNAYDAMHKAMSDDTSATEGQTINGITDPEMIALGEKISITGNDTPENLEILHDYLTDNAMIFGLIVNRGLDVTVKDITKTTMFSNVAYLGAFEFTPDYDVKK